MNSDHVDVNLDRDFFLLSPSDGLFPRVSAPSLRVPSRLPRMHGIAPASKDTATATLEKSLWAAAELRAHGGLTSAQCSHPVLTSRGRSCSTRCPSRR